MFEEGLPMETKVQSTRDTATNVGSEGKKVLFFLFLDFFFNVCHQFVFCQAPGILPR